MKPNQPLVVYFTTNRFLSKLPPTLPKVKELEKSMAYSKALTQLEVSLNDFANWYRVLQAEREIKSELVQKLFQNIEYAIKNFLPDMKNLNLISEKQPKFIIEKNNTTLYLEQLSDGERGLLAMVFDLTRRLAIANPDSDNPISEGKAIVMIDEIELHLHPKWQREVLGKMLSVFKNCQFIVTTHSPMVLGEAQAKSVRFLEYDDSGKVIVTIPDEAYGMDANRVLQELMGASIRNKKVEKELEELFRIIDAEEFDLAKEKIAELSKKLGEFDPELTRASSLIHFLEGDE